MCPRAGCDPGSAAEDALLIVAVGDAHNCGDALLAASSVSAGLVDAGVTCSTPASA
jgi:hypothetical protein